MSVIIKSSRIAYTTVQSVLGLGRNIARVLNVPDWPKSFDDAVSRFQDAVYIIDFENSWYTKDSTFIEDKGDGLRTIPINDVSYKKVCNNLELLKDIEWAPDGEFQELAVKCLQDADAYSAILGAATFSACESLMRLQMTYHGSWLDPYRRRYYLKKLNKYSKMVGTVHIEVFTLTQKVKKCPPSGVHPFDLDIDKHVYEFSFVDGLPHTSGKHSNPPHSQPCISRDYREWKDEVDQLQQRVHEKILRSREEEQVRNKHHDLVRPVEKGRNDEPCL